MWFERVFVRWRVKYPSRPQKFGLLSYQFYQFQGEEVDIPEKFFGERVRMSEPPFLPKQLNSQTINLHVIEVSIALLIHLSRF